MKRTAIDLDLGLHRPVKPEEFWNYPRDPEIRRAIDSLNHGGPDRLSIFWGAPGTGKTSVAYLYGMWASCLDTDSRGMPCGACEACHRVRFHYDNSRHMFYEFDASTDSLKDHVLSTFEHLNARQMDFADDVTAIKSGRKSVRPGIIFIDEAHRMSSKDQDKLLKPLEWNRDLRYVLATTKPDSLDPCLIDRAVDSYEFTHPEPGESAIHMKRIAGEHRGSLTDDAANMIVDRFGPSTRKCLAALGKLMNHNLDVNDKLFVEMYGKPSSRLNMPESA